MATRWEVVVSLAREVDEDCASGRPPDGTKVARLARAVLEFQHQILGRPERALAAREEPSTVR